MNALINEGKTKGFNCMLRALHYSLLLLIVNRATNAAMILCPEPSTAYHHISYVVTLIILVIAVVGVCYIHFKYQFPRVEFFVGLVVEVLLVAIIIWYSFSSIRLRQRECMQVILMQKWAIFSSFRLFVQISLVMAFKIFWIQRYTNGPGNLTWAYMFLTINWDTVTQVKSLYLAIGITYTIISLLTLILNVASRKADRASFTKYLQVWWIMAIVTMAIFQVIAAIKAWSALFDKSFYEIGAKRMLFIFIMGNLVDILFWGWGLLTLRVESGDVVREGLEDEKVEEELQLQVQEVIRKRSSSQINQLGTVYR